LKGRIKDFDSYYSKKLRLLKKAWSDKSGPLPVNDIIAVRVVCPFLGDLAIVERILARHFSIEEIERKGSERSFREFGYESIHVLIRIPDQFMTLCKHLERNVIEIQLRTILQEAWAEVEHELVYKAEFTPFDEPMRRKLAALNANLTLSDIIFQEILEFEKRLNAELGHRREAFYRRIEEVSEDIDIPKPVEALSDQGTSLMDAQSGQEHVMTSSHVHEGYGVLGMDGLLLAALEAHNKADFSQAVHIYTVILDEKPEKEIASVVYKHRGMAFFAQAKYHEALQDFSACLILDPDCYKALYYRGVVKGILEDHPGAADDFTAALKIHPYHFFSRYRRAVCFFKMGDTALAHADCEIALRIEPENSLAKTLFSRIRDRMTTMDF
jgi:putative GTP pyrophosphokinase